MWCNPIYVFTGFQAVMYSNTNHRYLATNLSLACLLLPYDPEHKAGNMSSWWGPTWISVRCHGKSEWTSFPVGSAQTQRRAQMKPPTSATPTHPCQVKTTSSDPQIDRQLACQLLCTACQVHGKATNVSFCPSWFDPVRNINICLIIKFSGFIPCPFDPSWHLLYLIYPPAICPERSAGINCPTSSWWSGAGFSRCLSVCSLSIPLGR